MPLLPSSRLRSGDIAAWERHRSEDRARSSLLARKIDESTRVIREFADAHEDPCYIAVSWGKDSVVTADLALRAGMIDIPLVWIAMEDPWEMPECYPVRDAFLALYPEATYHEYRSARGTWQDTVSETWDEIADRTITGIRADESHERRMRWRAHGFSTRFTCAPLSKWTADDVFAYHELHGLPLSAVYGMTLGGRLPRTDIRTAVLDWYNDDRGGEEFGRREWEATYFPEMQVHSRRE